MKNAKKNNLENGMEMLDILSAHDFIVQEFSPYHYRINNRLDIWPSTKKWYDMPTMRKGVYSDLIKTVRNICNQ